MKPSKKSMFHKLARRLKNNTTRIKSFFSQSLEGIESIDK